MVHGIRISPQGGSLALIFRISFKMDYDTFEVFFFFLIFAEEFNQPILNAPETLKCINGSH